MKGNSKYRTAVSALIISLFAAFQVSAAGKIALVYPNQTEKILGQSDWIKKEFTDLELLLLNNKYSYSVISESDVEDELNQSYDLAIVLNAKYLSDDALDEILNFVERGGALLCNWSFAFYDDDGDKREEIALSENLGLEIESELPRDNFTMYHTIEGNSPLSLNVPNGYRLKIRSGRNPVSVKTDPKKTEPLGYWRSEYELTSGYTPYNKLSGFIYGNAGKGKFVWFGFDTNSIIKTNPNKKYFENVLVNSIDWLLGRQKAAVSAWPMNKKAAAVFACDVANGGGNLDAIISLFENKKVKCQYLLSYPPSKKEILDRIARNEIGLYPNLNKGFKGQSYDMQFNLLNDIKMSVEASLNKNAVSIRSSLWDYDNSTLEVMKKLGIYTIFGDINLDSPMPAWISEKILGFPKSGSSFKEIASAQKIKDPSIIAEAMMYDFDRVYDEGGLYIFGFDTGSFQNTQSITALGSAVDKIISKDVWITTAGEIYDWWTLKDNIELNLYKAKENSYDLQIENKNNKAVNNLTVMITSITDKPSIGENKNLTAFYDSANNNLFLNITKLEPGEKTYFKLK